MSDTTKKPSLPPATPVAPPSYVVAIHALEDFRKQVIASVATQAIETAKP
jgi:hypothetical protein